jgi:flagellar biosynthesis protein FlhF
MKMKHYRAADMRQALRAVREAQGPDAVILSTRRISGGVEVCAAVDYDEQPDDVGYGAADFIPPARPAAQAGVADEAGFDEPGDFASLVRRTAAPADDVAASITDSALGEELRTMRRMLETQFASLAWNDLSRRAPIQVELLKQLTALGLAQDLATEVVTQMPSKMELAEAQRMALALLARRIEVAQEPWIETGGVVAMVGPTGVGKTTLVAKLAARWVMRHGARDIALISADAVRIGAQEQIHTLGRLLGAPAYAIEGINELPALLDSIGQRRLVLIDTAGLSPRDARLGEELAALAEASPRMQTTLVLSAAAQAGAIEEAVERFAPAKAASCVLTKLDEATSLGGAVSMLIRSRLPVAYLSDGQRIPEDLMPARAHQIIAKAVDLSRRAGASPDEDLLQRRFGAVAHALA